MKFGRFVKPSMPNRVFSNRWSLKLLFVLVGCSLLLSWRCSPVTTTNLAPQRPTEEPISPTHPSGQLPITLSPVRVTPIQTLTTSADLSALTPSPSTVAATPEPLTAWLNDFAAYLEALAAKGQFSGAALVARNDEPILEVAYGLADRSLHLSNQIGTKFNLGSMNKMFTAVAILQLVEQGKLSIDGTIANVLPDYPNYPVANAVTIDQLLTHTAGMGDCFSGEFFTTPAEQLKTVAGYLPLFVDKPLEFDPGTQYAYSNEGYIVLGLVIEKITGESYFDYVRENIYAPSSMINTDAFELDTRVPDLAIGYTTQDAEGNETGILAEHTSLMPIKGTPAGGGYSTIEDLFRFRNALLGNRLLNPESTQRLLTGKVEIRDNVRYAYGFLEKMVDGQRIVGHGGNAPGVCNVMDMHLEGGNTIIVLSNSDDGCMLVRDYLNENPFP